MSSIGRVVAGAGAGRCGGSLEVDVGIPCLGVADKTMLSDRGGLPPAAVVKRASS